MKIDPPIYNGTENKVSSQRVSPEEMHSVKNQILHGLYLLLYSFVKYISIPFSNYLRYFVIRLFSSSIKSSHISDGVMIWFPWRVKIDRRVSLNQGVIIDGFGKVTIGRGTRIAAYTCINTADHEFDSLDRLIADQGYITGEVIIEEDVWIGSNVMVNKCIRIGKGSVIGSGSVVTKDIPPYSIAVGVPCQVIRSRRK